MQISRRGFLQGILAAAAAPAIVKAGSIMRINPGRVIAPPERIVQQYRLEGGPLVREIVVYTINGDCLHVRRDSMFVNPYGRGGRMQIHYETVMTPEDLRSAERCAAFRLKADAQIMRTAHKNGYTADDRVPLSMPGYGCTEHYKP